MGKRKGDLKIVHERAVDIATLLQRPDLLMYHEPERKFDARNRKTLNQVISYILRDPAYTLVNDPENLDIPAGIVIDPKLLGTYKDPYATANTPRRYRVYFDTPYLEAADLGVELRIEHPKVTAAAKKKPYQQVIKIGREGTSDSHTLDRLEFPGNLECPLPSFDCKLLDGNKDVAEFLQANLDPNDMYGLLMLMTVRTRLWCRLKDAPDTLVEFGIDRGEAVTLTGYRYPILQVEPEIKHGRKEALQYVEERLLHTFSDLLTVNLRSKAAPGIDHMRQAIGGDPQVASWMRSNLRPEIFRPVTREECPLLFPGAVRSLGRGSALFKTHAA